MWRPLLEKIETELNQELEQILDYWASNTVDKTSGGFVGQIDSDNHFVPFAPKGAVLTARICWTFAAAYQVTQSKLHYKLAERAYSFLLEKFYDPVHDGFYWTVDANGHLLDDKKHTYAQAFVLYAFSQWYAISRNVAVLQQAIQLYQLIKSRTHDPVHGGYFEAFARDWSAAADFRLSEKDANEAKSMNTHLHLLEAFSCLYIVWPDPALESDIRELLNLFETTIIDPGNHHLRLFFTAAWDLRSDTISWGHDIEAGWLMLEAATTIGDKPLIARFRQFAVLLTGAALEGMDEEGGLWYEFEPAGRGMIREKHWWPQAEALVGLFNAWEISSNEFYLEQLSKTWAFIQRSLKDCTYGEWYWGIDASGQPMPNQDKVGIWKCPYHNGRACIELISRIRKLLNRPTR